MSLTERQREQIIATAVDLLRHRRRDRLIEILERRITEGDYPDGLGEERELDRVAHAIARAVEQQLREEDGD